MKKGKKERRIEERKCQCWHDVDLPFAMFPYIKPTLERYFTQFQRVFPGEVNLVLRDVISV